MFHWLRQNGTLVAWMTGLSVLMFVGSLVLVTVLIVRMPADYFAHRKPPPDSWRGQHPIIRILVLVIKNVVGFLLVVLGVLLSLPGVPGQGVLTILIGLTMLNFPGKRRLELRIVRSRPVNRAINWIRTKNHRPPLDIPDHDGEAVAG
jgi:archaellum biogenesis protein FlaJ (TadC family)